MKKHKTIYSTLPGSLREFRKDYTIPTILIISVVLAAILVCVAIHFSK